MPSQTFDSRRLVGIKAERVTDVSSTEFPGHYPNEDLSWDLSKFEKVRYYSKSCCQFFFCLLNKAPLRKVEIECQSPTALEPIRRV